MSAHRKVFLSLTLSAVLILSGCATAAKRDEDFGISEADPEAKWGIRVEGIRLSAADYMLDFRYRVIDPKKAKALFKREDKPYVIDQKTGAKFMVPSPPKVGPLRTSDIPQEGKIYFIIFANPGKYIKRGNPVTVVIGNFQAKDLIVQ